MPNYEKSVFISYRRKTSWPLAQLIYDRLKHLGYDVFLDTQNLGNGKFPEKIIQNVKGRAHFLPLLTTNTLERCKETDDWVRKEIELAIEYGRNIVPLFTDDFSFRDFEIYLTDKLMILKDYNGVTLHPDLFNESILRLHRNFLSDKSSVPSNIYPILLTDESNESQDYTGQPEVSHSDDDSESEEHWIQGYVYVINDKLQSALEEFNKALNLEPNNVSALINRAVLYLHMGEPDKALGDLNQVTSIDSSNSSAYNNKGIAYALKGDFAEAILNHSKAIELNPNNFRSYSNRGLAYHNIHKNQKALADFDKALTIEPYHVPSLQNRAVIYDEMNKPDLALADWDLALTQDAENAQLYYERGLLYYRLATAGLDKHKEHLVEFENSPLLSSESKEVQSALRDFTDALKHDPEFVNAYFERAGIYLLLRRFDEALGDLNIVIEMSDPNAESFFRRASIYMMQANLVSARADYTRTLNIDANHTDAYIGRGRSYQLSGDMKSAIKDYKKALDIDPKNVFVHNELGLVYVEQGDLEKAIQEHTKAIQLNPTFHLSYYNRGICYRELRRFRLARADFQKSVELYPLDADGYYNLGTIDLMVSEKPQDALVALNKAAAIRPNDPNILLNLGDCIRRN